MEMSKIEPTRGASTLSPWPLQVASGVQHSGQSGSGAINSHILGAASRLSGHIWRINAASGLSLPFSLIPFPLPLAASQLCALTTSSWQDRPEMPYEQRATISNLTTPESKCQDNGEFIAFSLCERIRVARTLAEGSDRIGSAPSY